jgi:hypothetical protein
VPPPPASPAEQLDFIKRQANSDTEFSDRDHDLLSRLPGNPEAGSFAEAALFLGVVGAATQPQGILAPSFEEADITDVASSGPKHSAGNGAAMEKMARERGLNLIDALSENIWLKSAAVARRVYQATKVTSDAEDFKRDLIATISREAAKWNNLVNDIGGISEPTPGVISTAPGIATQDNLAPLPQDLPPPNPADLRGGDAVLAEAQSLADRGNFQAAIKKAATVSPTSPMHANAQEKIRDFSNLAVQDLRRKAAQSFQSAMPITDVNIRAQYLEQAKQYLEQAIKEYPQATQLPTVRDNLRVISRDLDKLQAEKG